MQPVQTDLLQFTGAEAKVVHQHLVFAVQVGAEQGRVVRVDGDQL